MKTLVAVSTIYFSANRYTIAVLNEHVDPGFPYISDTGSYSPESCIFGQLVNITAFIREYFTEIVKRMQTCLNVKNSGICKYDGF
jgi:hypothetical protein